MAKRVNKRFLIILTVVVAALGVGAFAAQRLLHRKDPAKYVELGKQAERDGDLKRARDNYRIAFAADNTNKDVLVRLGNVYEQLAGEDIENLRLARMAWNNALQIDPNYPPALQRVLDSDWTEAELTGGRPDLYQRIRDAAERLAAADPTNLKAQARVHLATLRSWARGTPLQPAELDKAVAALAELAKRQPADAELPAAVAQAKLQRAGELGRTAGRRDEARALIDQAVAVMDDALAAPGQAQNPAMQFRAYQIYSATAGGLDPQAEKARADALRAKGAEALNAAVALAKPDDELYVDIHVRAATQAQVAGDPARAKQITSDLLKVKPRDQRARLAHAQVLKNDPDQRAAAVALLNEPVDDSPEATRGMLAFRQKLLAAETIRERVQVQMIQYGALTKAADQRALMAEMRQSVKKLEGLNLYRPEDPRLLSLRGNLDLIEGRFVDAAELLERAARQMSPASGEYYELKFRLAGIYAQLGQTGPARKHLDEVLTTFPRNPAARAQMAGVLLQENSLDAAEQQIKELKALVPADAPEVQRLEVALMERRQPGSSAGVIAKLPEGTRAEKLRKAQALLAVKQTEAGEKLLEGLIAADPKDLEAVGALASYYAGANQVDKATALLESALKANPGNRAIEEGLKRLRTQSSEDLYNYQKERIAAVADEARRELALYDLERQFNHRDEAAAHLARAQALKPDDVAVQVRQFDWAVAGAKWDEAAALVDKLAKADADEIGGRLYRFRLEVARGNYKAAEDAATQMTQERPNFSQGFAALAQAQHAQQKYREAIGNYRQALDRRPLDYDSLRGMIACQYALNAPNDARQALADARRRFPSDRTFIEMELAHELEYGDPEKVVAEREKQFKESPDRPEGALALAGAYLQAVEKKYLASPNTAKVTELRTRARDVLAAALKKWPADVRMAASLAEVQQWLGDANGAKQTIEAFAARDDQKGKPTADLLRADYFNRLRQPEQAEAAMRDALKAAAADKNAAAEIRQRLVASLAQRGKNEEALALLKEGGEVPSESRLFRQQVQLLVNLGKFDEARQAVEQALAKSPQSVDLQNVRTAVLLEAGKLDEAEASANQTKPDDEMTHYYLGLVHLRRQPPAAGRAVQELAVAVSRNPRNYNILSGLADAYQAAGQTNNAVAEQRKAVALAPTNRPMRAKLIDLLITAGRFDDVLAQANEAKAYPQLAGDWIWDRSAAIALSKSGKFREAGQRIDQAMALATEADKPGLYRDRMDLLLAAKDFAGALKAADELLASGRKDWWVYQYRGLAKAGAKDTAGALTEFDQALKGVDPKTNAGAAETVARSIAATVGYQKAIERIVPFYETTPGFRLLAAELYKAGGDYPNATTTVESLLADADRLKLPKQARAMALRSAGEIYLSDPKPQVEKAIGAYTRLVELVPEDVLSLNNLAYLLAQEVNPPRPNEAKVFSQRAYDIGRAWTGGNGQILDTHGWVLVLTGENRDVEEGIRILTQAVELGDSSVPLLESHYHLGEAYLRKSKPEPAQAAKQFQIALNLIAKAKQAGQPVDPKLEGQIKSGVDRAQQMSRAGAS